MSDQQGGGNVYKLSRRPQRQSQGGNGGGGDDLGEIKERLARLEERTSHLATKDDLQRMETTLVKSQNTQLRWIIGGMGAMLLAALGVIAGAIFQ